MPIVPPPSAGSSSAWGSITGTLSNQTDLQTALAAKAASNQKLDDFGTPDDNTDLNATTARHGLLPKLGGGSTNFLRADGTWAAPAGGKVLQVVVATKTDAASSSSTAFTTLFQAAITPQNAGSTILVFLTASVASTNGYGAFWRLSQGGSQILLQGDAGLDQTRCQSYTIGTNTYVTSVLAMNGSSQPGVTSEISFELQGAAESGGVIYLNRSSGDSNSYAYPRPASSMILIEIAP